jgi:hypothetical protein
MRYIDLLKMYVHSAAWVFSAAIITYGIVCYLGGIQPIHISTGMIAQFVSITFFSSLGVWWFDLLKK